MAPVLRDDRPVQRGIWVVTITLIVAIVLAIDNSTLGKTSVGVVLTLLIATQFVGWGEEGMFRGISVVTLRRHSLGVPGLQSWSIRRHTPVRSRRSSPTSLSRSSSSSGVTTSSLWSLRPGHRSRSRAPLDVELELTPEGIAADTMAIAWRKLSGVPPDDPTPALAARSLRISSAALRAGCS